MGVGVGAAVGTGEGFLGRTSISLASSTSSSRFVLLYCPAARMRLLMRGSRSILLGICRVMASEEVVTR